MDYAKAVALILLFLLHGCASTEMYTHDGFLTKYGMKQTDSEFEAIYNECKAKHERTSSKRYTCYRQLVPLKSRLDQSFSDLYTAYLESATNITKGFEAGNISEVTTIETLDGLREEWEYQNSLLLEEYNRIVATRNAREKYAARQRMGMALSQVGSDLMKQSSSSRSVTCTETVPGTVSCSEW